MRKFTVLSMVSLDGVIQAPGGPEEDPSNDFTQGGWVAPYGDDTYDKIVAEELKPADYLLGRKTFQIWENYWPEHANFWPGINEGTKYVLSGTRNHSTWKNTLFLNSLSDIKTMKNTPGKDIQIWGSSELVHLLLENDLVDEFRLKIHPLILGKGKKLFADGAVSSAYKLTHSLITTKGVIIATYQRSGAVQTGRIEK